MTTPRAPEPWYADGLRFGCTQCHHCCRGGRDGAVYVAAHEIERIAAFLKTTTASFRRRFVRRREGNTTIRLNAEGDCALWKNGCTVYEARPRQCRTFPFWSENLKSPSAWQEAARECEGIGQGEVHDLVQIRSILRRRA